MLTLTSTGNYNKTFEKLNKLKKLDFLIVPLLHKYGAEGVASLQEYTPKETGLTALSWSYEVVKGDGRYILSFKNSNFNNGVPIAVILQYGHGTRNGGYVEGIDYINPALKPVFEEIISSFWKEVESS